MQEQTYLFYDVETTGTHEAFDQIVQFAAIRTDAQLNELERHELFVRLNPDTVPTPEAMMTHQIPIEKLQKEGHFEYQALQTIHQLMTQPNTINIGYNSMRFDDQFLRFGFFRNLLPPYLHQFQSGCFRMDLYPMVALYYQFAPAVLQWPEQQGKVSLKLENLNNENQLYIQGQAHDALTDVAVTVALARQLKQHDSAIWQFCHTLFHKTSDQKKASQWGPCLPDMSSQWQQVIGIDGIFGATAGFMSYFVSLGGHQYYRNQWCFLRLDTLDFYSYDDFDAWSQAVWVIKKRWGDLPFILPAKSRFFQQFNAEQKELVTKNQQFLASRPEWLSKLSQLVTEQLHESIDPATVDPDASLYQEGFLDAATMGQCYQFHQAKTVDQKIALIDQMTGNVKQRAIRIMGRMAPEQLPMAYWRVFEAYLYQITTLDESGLRPIDYRGNPRLSVAEVKQNIEKYLNQPDLAETKRKQLKSLAYYLNLM